MQSNSALFSEELPQGLPKSPSAAKACSIIDQTGPPLSPMLPAKPRSSTLATVCRRKNRPCHGRAVLATLLRAHHTVFIPSRPKKISATSTRSRPAKFFVPVDASISPPAAQRPPKRPSSWPDNFISKAVNPPRYRVVFSPPELSRQHSRNYDRQRQRRTPCTLSAVARRNGDTLPRASATTVPFEMEYFPNAASPAQLILIISCTPNDFRERRGLHL